MKKTLFLLSVFVVLFGCNEYCADNSERKVYDEKSYLHVKNFQEWIRNTISYITIDETDFANQLKLATHNVPDDKLLTVFLQTVESGASCASRNRSIIYLYAIGFVVYVSKLDKDIQESIDTTLSRLLTKNEIPISVLYDPLGFNSFRDFSEETDETVELPDDTPCKFLYYDKNTYERLYKQYINHLRQFSII